MLGIAVLSIFVSLPKISHADGSQTYATPGSYSFTVPAYGTLTVQVWGAGGGGGGAGGAASYVASDGSAGTYSAFSSLISYGGNGGPRSIGNSNTGSATGGTASGGSTNITGNPGGTGQAYYGYCYCSGAGGSSPNGGVGGASVTGMQGGYFASGNAGGVPGAGGSGGTANFGGHILHAGGGGGSGGYSSKIYSAGQLTTGQTITVVVGSAGAGGGPSSQGGTYGGAGASGRVTITWTTSTPSCTINAAPTTINQPSGTSLSWTSANATTFYITNVGYVTANVSSGATVYPAATVTYSGTATGPGGTANCSRTVTVNRSCTFNGNTILHGATVTAYQASSVAYGNSCVSQTRTCADGTLSGTYAYASCTVGSPANCTLDGVTVPHGTSRTFYTQQTAPIGLTCSSGSVSQSRTCTSGVLSGTATYQYATCGCAPTYSCAGNDIQYSNASCVTSTVATCTAPSFCTAGQSTCQYNAMTFTSFTATTTTGSSFTATGHLQARPGLVRSGDRARLYWKVSNAQSCTVTGTNGDSWAQISSPTGGYPTSQLTSLTRFTLSCTAYPSVLPASLQETATVLLSPDFSEN